MRCSRCHREAVVTQDYSGLRLCAEHLLRDIGAKAKRTIRTRRWLEPRDHIAVALSGGAASAAVLAFLQDLVGKRRDIRLSAIHVTGMAEGPGTGREISAREIAEACGVPFAAIPATGIIPDKPAAGTGSGEELPAGEPCSGNAGRVVPVLSRYGREQGITKIALGTVLEDRAEAVLTRIFTGTIASLADIREPGAGTGPAVIHPFLFVPEDEAILAAALRFPGREFPPGERSRDAFCSDVNRLLDDYTSRHPSTRYSLVRMADRLEQAAGTGGTSCELGNPAAGSPDRHHAGNSPGRSARW